MDKMAARSSSVKMAANVPVHVSIEIISRIFIQKSFNSMGTNLHEKMLAFGTNLISRCAEYCIK